MNFSRLSKNIISQRDLSSLDQPTPYVRPSDQITNPTIDSTTQAFQGVYAVFNNGTNYCSLMFTTSSGNYQVDQGDGNTNTYASGVQADHVYVYSTCISNGSPVCSRGYCTVRIAVTPVSGHLLTMDLHKKNGSIAPAYYNGYWLDLQVNAQYLTSINSPSAQIVYFQLLEIFNINNNSLTTCDYLCNNFKSLKSFSFSNSSVTSVSYMFFGCYSLQSVPLFNLSNCTGIISMFNGCSSLQSVPLFNLIDCTDASYMFNGCYSLQSVPLFNLSNCGNTSYMFQNCYSLQSVPLFNLSNCGYTSYMFNGCYSLQSVPLFNLSSCTNTSSMFNGCYSLQSVPLFNLSNCGNTGSMFNVCYSLQSVPAFNLNNSTNASSMFSYCYSLQSINCAPKTSFSVINCNLSSTALNTLYTNLPTVTGQTLTITNCPGSSGSTKTIATAKGWTIVG